LFVEINSQTKLIKMKKITLCILSAFFMLTIMPSQLKAENVENSTSTVDSKTTETVTGNAILNTTATNENSANTAINAENAIAEAQLARLEEIRTMDKSELTASEKKELRNEVHEIQRDEDRRDRDNRRGDYEGRRHNGGVFILGGGGLLLIILILLLL